jgi:hypothetical protein
MHDKVFNEIVLELSKVVSSFELICKAFGSLLKHLGLLIVVQGAALIWIELLLFNNFSPIIIRDTT